MSNSSADLQGLWRRRRRRSWSQHWSRHSPEVHGEDHGEAGCAPAAHGPQWSRFPPAACGGLHARVGGCAWRRLWICGKPTLEQVPGRSCDPTKRSLHWGWCRGCIGSWVPHFPSASPQGGSRRKPSVSPTGCCVLQVQTSSMQSKDLGWQLLCSALLQLKGVPSWRLRRHKQVLDSIIFTRIPGVDVSDHPDMMYLSLFFRWKRTCNLLVIHETYITEIIRWNFEDTWRIISALLLYTDDWAALERVGREKLGVYKPGACELSTAVPTEPTHRTHLNYNSLRVCDDAAAML